MSKTILLMAGGTGGHIFPALAVGKYLEAQGWKLHWLGSVGKMEERIVPEHNIPIDLLPVKAIRGKGFISLLKAPFNIISSVLEAKKMIKKINPDVVLGMGGFASGPGGIAAKLMGIPLVIHEQNAIAGMTNKWLHKFSNITLQAYPGAFKGKKKVITTGNPVRADFKKITDKQFSENGHLKVLIVGGSLGAEILNEKVPETMEIVNADLNIEVWHQTGRGNLSEVEARYDSAKNDKANNNVTAKVTEFIDDMGDAYAWADLVICRAGALTVAEVAMSGVCAIFVPFPYAVDDHQTHNARYLSDESGAILIPQHNLQAETLADQITALANNKNHMKNIADKALSLAKENATESVAKFCINVASNNNLEKGGVANDNS